MKKNYTTTHNRMKNKWRKTSTEQTLLHDEENVKILMCLEGRLDWSENLTLNILEVYNVLKNTMSFWFVYGIYNSLKSL